jgi:phage terminase large subunit
MIDINIPRRAINDAYLSFVEDTTQTQILYGGSSSGKSRFLAQRTVIDLLKGKRNYLICRKLGKYVMKSVWLEVESVINEWGLSDFFAYHKSDRVITCRTGKQAIFTGLDEPQKLKSIRAKDGAITDIWIEEATETVPADLKELEKRQRGGDDTPKRVTLSFNPILKSHWIYKTYFSGLGWADNQTRHSGEKLSILKTTYKDNRFLTTQDVERLESETDKYYHDVYTLGNWGILGNVIFTNWRVEDLSGMRDQFTNRRHGLDFGFAQDPAALWVSHYEPKYKRIYLYDELYERGLTNDILSDEVTKKVSSDPVACDSAEPKSIRELSNHGVSAYAVKKGKDSVLYGIQWMQQQEIIIDVNCINAQNEFSMYKWREDKDGNVIKQPVDKNNHLIDGGRYAYENDMGGGVSSIENPFYN